MLFLESFSWGSVVGVAIRYGLNGPEIESWWGRDFPHLSKPTVEWVPDFFPGGEVADAWR